MVLYPITASIYNWLIQHATRRKLCSWKQRQSWLQKETQDSAGAPLAEREAQCARKDGNNRAVRILLTGLISHGGTKR